MYLVLMACEEEHFVCGTHSIEDSLLLFEQLKQPP